MSFFFASVVLICVVASSMNVVVGCGDMCVASHRHSRFFEMVALSDVPDVKQGNV